MKLKLMNEIFAIQHFYVYFNIHSFNVAKTFAVISMFELFLNEGNEGFRIHHILCFFFCNINTILYAILNISPAF